MLEHLEIRNYALIENLSVDFSSGFNVITGETGSGKSIILRAFLWVKRPISPPFAQGLTESS